VADSGEPEKLSEQLVLRVSEADKALLRRVAGPVSRSLVAREALRIGLRQLAKDRRAVMRLTPVPPGPKPRRRPKD
jgi:hypothetical protein